MTISGSDFRIARIVSAKCLAPPSARSSRATAVITTCFNFMRRIASATRAGSSVSKAKGLAVVTAQKPQARVHLSPAIMNVAVPWLQHSQRFGHCADSQTVCSRRSEIRALVEKKTGLDGNRTLIHSGFLDWCNDGSIFRARHRCDQATGSELEKQPRKKRQPVEFYRFENWNRLRAPG